MKRNSRVYFCNVFLLLYFFFLIHSCTINENNEKQLIQGNWFNLEYNEEYYEYNELYVSNSEFYFIIDATLLQPWEYEIHNDSLISFYNTEKSMIDKHKKIKIRATNDKIVLFFNDTLTSCFYRLPQKLNSYYLSEYINKEIDINQYMESYYYRRDNIFKHLGSNMLPWEEWVKNK